MLILMKFESNNFLQKSRVKLCMGACDDAGACRCFAHIFLVCLSACPLRRSPSARRTLCRTPAKMFLTLCQFGQGSAERTAKNPAKVLGKIMHTVGIFWHYGTGKFCIKLCKKIWTKFCIKFCIMLESYGVMAWEKFCIKFCIHVVK